MKKKRALVVLDSFSIFNHFGKKHGGGRINFEYLYNFLDGTYDLVRVFIYGVDFGEVKPAFKGMLKAVGYSTKYLVVPAEEKEECKFLNNNSQMFADALNYIDDFEVLVIGSHDRNLIPMVKYFQDHKKEVIVANCYVNRELREVCDNNIDFDESFIYTGATNGVRPYSESAFRSSSKNVPEGTSASFKVSGVADLEPDQVKD